MVCIDDSQTRLIGEARATDPDRIGTNSTLRLRILRQDPSTCNAHRPWRKVRVSDQRTAQDFAECMRDLVDVH
jgi:hypothetical protein